MPVEFGISRGRALTCLEKLSRPPSFSGLGSPVVPLPFFFVMGSLIK